MKTTYLVEFCVDCHVASVSHETSEFSRIEENFCSLTSLDGW